VVPPLFVALVDRATSAGCRSNLHAITGAPGRFYLTTTGGSSGCSRVFSGPHESAGLTPFACSLLIVAGRTVPVDAL